MAIRMRRLGSISGQDGRCPPTRTLQNPWVSRLWPPPDFTIRFDPAASSLSANAANP